ncbi:hypothetical protein SAMN05421776_1177 [Nocardia farcinica]|uniref:Uncharacterized protein n=1 Tax=Nocardia farcinica TaxID=37329 RepID=A0A0H5NX19_NOCFR|nr:hypothetical protein [Nocardia farcinica]AXK86577.1 hypothetical protein DXT66_13910 [Nocardia farcinica]PFW99014.1 hypothetical protein CJ469_05614 [Nocardia farcinica]PFX06052.1 hypothetical protein CJ468_04912 [Nocardia farcinica]CRY79858.1 Uncharacterised protein [Nocardia farcinica]SIT33568.1 hypothetical protein SAMN05421776_1177 [Nocardia farcinica]
MSLYPDFQVYGKVQEVYFRFDEASELSRDRAIEESETGRSVDPAYGSFVYLDEGSGWEVDKIMVTGRLWRKTGGLGNLTTINPACSDLPPELRAALEGNRPKG